MRNSNNTLTNIKLQMVKLGKMVRSTENKMELKTVQSGAMRTLFEALKEVLTDVNIIFDSSGVKIISMDGSKVALVHLKLNGECFEKYVCKKKINAGVNMLSLFKLLKTINNNDTVGMFISEERSTELGILIENKEKNTLCESYLKLLDIDEDILQIPDVQFDSVITMPSPDFQKVCRDMSTISDTVCILSKENQLEISCQGDFASQKVVIGETSNGLVFSKKDAEVRGEFTLKYLNLFTKSTNLCGTVELFLKESYPLILVYCVANLGSLRYCLAPKVDKKVS